MSADLATQFTLQLLSKAPKNTLWCVDENISQIPLPSAGHQALTNRFDLFQQLQARNWPVVFNDFDFSEIEPHSLEAMVVRLPKEKALAHHLINQAAISLAPEGLLYLIGDKSEGVRGFNKRAQTRLGGALAEQKISGGLWLGQISAAPAVMGQPLDDQDYPLSRQVEERNGFMFISKPGLYGWQKVDQGSQYLVESLPKMLDLTLPISGKLLDLGCGYGYLSMLTAGSQTQLTCTDNNAAAIKCCETNLSRIGLKARVIASNAGDLIEDSFDIVLCNPPFHSGFSTQTDLTERFVAAAARLLQPTGQACFVVNKHIGLEQKAQKFFGKISLHSENSHFKLIHLSQPKH